MNTPTPPVIECERHDFGNFEPVEVYSPQHGDLIVTAKEERVCETCGHTETRTRVGSGCTAHWRYEHD